MISCETLGVLVALAASIYAYFKWSFQYWKRKNVPYIEPSVPFGSFHPPFGKNPGIVKELDTFYNKAKKNKWNYVGAFSGTRPWLILVDRDLIKTIFTKDFNNFTDRGEYYNEKHQPLSANLFFLEGTRWKNLRVKLTPTFTSGKMKLMFDTLVQCAKNLEENINELSNNKDGIDVKTLLGCFTTDIIGSCAFGLECNTLKEPTSPFRIYSKKIFEMGLLDELNWIFSINFPTLARAVGIVPFHKDVERFFDDIVKQTVKYRETSNVKRNDFLQLLIELRNQNAEGEGLTLDEIVAQSFVFFAAGHETSATTSTFALYELASNQKIQDKVREEIKTVLAKHNNVISYDSLKDMVYLQQVIDETLRMYPPVPTLTRVANNDYKIPDSDTVVKKGNLVIIPVTAIHYDEDIYPNPTVFDPDRFAPELKNSRHPYSHIPFGEGPRICIGMRFGLMQTKVGLVTALKNHVIKVNKKTQVPLKLNPFMFIPSVVGGIWLDFEKI